MSLSATYPLTILLVDDYAPGILVSMMMIEYLGYAAEAASCGKEAITKLHTSPHPFMAIMMDVNMHGMDGFETTKIIRGMEKENGHYNTIIAVTAHALAGDRERCIEAGMDDYISKPIHPDILAQKLATLARTMRKA